MMIFEVFIGPERDILISQMVNIVKITKKY